MVDFSIRDLILLISGAGGIKVLLGRGVRVGWAEVVPLGHGAALPRLRSSDPKSCTPSLSFWRVSSLDSSYLLSLRSSSELRSVRRQGVEGAAAPPGNGGSWRKWCHPRRS
jgi:hypothetical protein